MFHLCKDFPTRLRFTPNGSNARLPTGPPRGGGVSKGGEFIGARLAFEFERMRGIDSNSFLHVILWMTKALTINFVILCNSWKIKYSSIVGIKD